MQDERIQIFQRNIENASHDIAEVRDELRPVLLQFLSGIETNRILVAIEESLINIFEHGYAGGSGRIEFQAEKRGDTLVFSIEDRARVYDPTSAPLDDPERRAQAGLENGYGIYLLRALMNVSHEPREGGGNRLLLQKKLRSSGSIGFSDRKEKESHGESP